MEEIIKLLKQDELKNINLINFIKHNKINEIHQVKNSVLVKGTSDREWVYISSDQPEELLVLLNKIDHNDKAFAAIEEWMLPYLSKNNYAWLLSCIKMYYPNEVTIESPQAIIKPLSKAVAKYIYMNSDYSDYTTIEYIRDRIEKGIALGIYEHDQLVAWIMTHDDGAIGFLHVLEDFRNKGYAKDLTYHMIQRLREENQLPFVHIEFHNEKSLNLAKKVGFYEDRKLYWFELT